MNKCAAPFIRFFAFPKSHPTDVEMQFDFGKNWADFSNHALNSERVKEAHDDFTELLRAAGGLSGKSFLDIGFGQGLSLLNAASAGATVFGIDINPKCEAVLENNRRFFPELAGAKLPIVIGSILDESTVRCAREASPTGDGYDIVHSWGVLHHTGDMSSAIRSAASLVNPHGHLVIAIYNRHWSSGPWLLIKYLYGKSPQLLRRLLVWLLTPVIYAAKWIVTKDQPLKQARGMDFFYDVVDWVGGYPYEYASTTEILSLIEPLGFRCLRVLQSRVPTGCNEFVFQRS
jgi:SAM-dependent methyltransferase